MRARIGWIAGAAVALAACAATAAGFAASESANTDRPVFNSKNELLRPNNYREWVFLSSNVGMSYRQSPDDPDPMFTNVFVAPWAYREFLKSGHWPNGTMFVVEDRGSSGSGSITKRGRFQTGDFMGIGVEVKDPSRFSEKFAYFNFGDNQTASANPKSACWQCHNDHAAVENTMVQFYPTLKPVAMKYGTYWRENFPDETDWSGELSMPQQKKERVLLHLFNKPGQPSATIDLPDEDRYDVAVDPVELKGEAISFQLGGMGGPKFSGTMKADQINGTVTDNNGQGPLVLTKMAPSGAKKQ